MTAHPVPISETRHVPLANNPNKFKLGAGHNELPFDLPAVIEVARHLAPQGDPPKPGLVGWSMDIDVLSRGRVLLKIGHGGGMEVWVNGERVWKTEVNQARGTTQAS